MVITLLSTVPTRPPVQYARRRDEVSAAAGFLAPVIVPEEIGRTEVQGVAAKSAIFLARVTGATVVGPLIPDGARCPFCPVPAGSCESHILLVQFNTVGAGENGGRLTVKKYRSKKTITADGWRHERIPLLPLNGEFEKIETEPLKSDDVLIVGEYAKKYGKSEQD